MFRSRPTRVSVLPLRAVAGVVLVIAGVAGTVAVVSWMDQANPYLAVARDMVDGDIIAPDDLVVVYLHGRSGPLPYLTGDSSDSLVGQALTHPVGSGQLLSSSAVSPPEATDTTTVTLSLGIRGAGWLHPGARVDVWVSPSADQGLFGPPRVVAPGAVISQIRGEEGFASDPSAVNVDVVVHRRNVAAVVAALANNFPLALTPVAGGGGPG